MPVLKHTEFKLVCDECWSDITDYHGAKNQKKAMPTLKEKAKEYGAKYNSFNKKWFCSECKSK